MSCQPDIRGREMLTLPKASQSRCKRLGSTPPERSRESRHPPTAAPAAMYQNEVHRSPPRVYYVMPQNCKRMQTWKVRLTVKCSRSPQTRRRNSVLREWVRTTQGLRAKAQIMGHMTANPCVSSASFRSRSSSVSMSSSAVEVIPSVSMRGSRLRMVSASHS